MARGYKTWKLVIEFREPEHMLEVWEAMADVFPDTAEPFEADALDMGGRAEAGTFIVKNRRDRAPQSSLRELVAARDAAARTGGQAARRKVRSALRGTDDEEGEV